MTAPQPNKAVQRPNAAPEYATKAYLDEQLNKLRREISRSTVTQTAVDIAVSGLAARLCSLIPKLTGQGMRAALTEIGLSEAIGAGAAVRVEELSKAAAAEQTATERKHLQQLRAELAGS